MPKKPPMSTQTALTLAVLVLDFEAETAQANRVFHWAKETNEAAKILRKLKEQKESINANS